MAYGRKCFRCSDLDPSTVLIDKQLLANDLLQISTKQFQCSFSEIRYMLAQNLIQVCLLKIDLMWYREKPWSRKIYLAL